MKTQTFPRLSVFSIGIILLFFSSCQKDKTENLFKSQLVGTWNSTNYNHTTMVFKQDNTFVDSTYYIFSNPDAFQLGMVLTGNYVVDNDQLRLSNTRLLYFYGQDTQTNSGFSTSYEPLYNITFDGNILTLEPKVQLTLISGSNSKVVGKWNTEKLVAVYDNNLSNKFTGGIMKAVWEFKSDLTSTYNYDFIYDNITKSFNENINYEFNDPELFLKEYGFTVNVTFKKNQMIWTYYGKTYERKK